VDKGDNGKATFMVELRFEQYGHVHVEAESREAAAEDVLENLDCYDPEMTRGDWSVTLVLPEGSDNGQG
jgi:hypothetical protein